MKKAFIGIVILVLLVAVFSAVANPRWGYTRYGTMYSYPYGYSYYYAPSPYYAYPAYPYSYYRYTSYPSYTSPSYIYPYSISPSYPAYNYPYYNYPYSPLSSEAMYRYGAPTVTTPGYVSAELPRGAEGQLCGIVNSKQYGCTSGLVCDYTKGAEKGVGVCSRRSESEILPNWQYSGMYN